MLLMRAVILLHTCLVVTVIVCTTLALVGRLSAMRGLLVVYLLVGVAVVTSQLIYGECILTVWEKTLRNRYQPGSAYRTSFLAHYFPRLPGFVYDYVGPIFLVSGLIFAIVGLVKPKWSAHRTQPDAPSARSAQRH